MKKLKGLENEKTLVYYNRGKTYSIMTNSPTFY